MLSDMPIDVFSTAACEPAIIESASRTNGKGLAMRWTAILFMLVGGLWLVGCGDGGTPTPASVASHAGLPPPPPGGEGTPSPMPPGDETPPAEPTQEPTNPGGEYQPPTEGSADGGTALAGGENPGEGGGPDGYPEGMQSQPPRIKTWREQAEEALAAGNEQEWFRLVYTNYVVNPQSWPELDRNMAWIPALRRPAFGPRFGIGAVYHNPPKDFEGSPQPIGSSELATAMSSLQQSAGGGGSGGGETTRRSRRTRGVEGAAPGAESAGGEIPSQGPESGSAEESELTYYTGDFGSKLVAALKERIESGAYGALYREMAQTASRGPRRGDDPNNPGDGSGELAGLDGGTPDGGSVDQATGHSSPTTRDGAKRLATAVVWLGKAGSKEELVKMAQDANVDVLVTYEITLQSNKQISLVRNITKVKITTVKRDEPLFTSAGLENRLVLLARNKSTKAEDPVDQEIEKAMEALDKVLKPVALPAAVTGDVIKRRIAMLIDEKPADKLPAVVEARYYAAKGLISHDEATRAAMTLLGDAEYAEMILSTPFDPGSQQGLGQMVGRGLSLPGVLDMLSAANHVTGQTARNEEARQRQATEKPPTAPAAGGVRSLLPFGFGGQNK
jgi:hypothetical protein